MLGGTKEHHTRLPRQQSVFRQSSICIEQLSPWHNSISKYPILLFYATLCVSKYFAWHSWCNQNFARLISTARQGLYSFFPSPCTDDRFTVPSDVHLNNLETLLITPCLKNITLSTYLSASTADLYFKCRVKDWRLRLYISRHHFAPPM